ncbi:Protein STIP1-like protein [Diplonema papillatum]|nr:Protein STIP1-like protein [Diplonema papillatum]
MASSAQMVLDFKKSGNEAFQTGRYQEAIAMYSMAIELDPTNEVLFSNRSAAFCKGGIHDQAMDDADTARTQSRAMKGKTCRATQNFECLQRRRVTV